MTRRNYELIAWTLASVRAYVPAKLYARIAVTFASALSDANAKFNRAQFLVACEVKP